MNKTWKIASVSGLVIVAAMPLFLSLGYALLYSFGIVGALNSGFTLGHWQKLFSEGTAIQSFFYSASIACLTLLLSVGFSLHLALKHHEAFSKGFLSAVIYLPLAFPAMVSAFFFFQFMSRAGFLSRFVYKIGLTSSMAEFPDLINDKWGIGIVTAQTFISAPFFLLLYLSRIKTEHVESFLLLASTLGASRQQAIRRIAVPLLLRKTFPNILLYFIFIFGSYEIPLLLGRSKPEMISVFAVRKLQKFNLTDIPQGYAIAILYTIVTLSILIISLRTQKASHDS